MTDFQIFLLPEHDYWTWLRACQEYVMAYGANLTSSRETAARYMAPRQVISFPVGESTAPVLGDFAKWMEENYERVRLDPIPAERPEDLKVALAQRMEQDDRYGQRQKPFYLLWPTDYPIITQRFGANPQIYTRFGMPGHEGLDIRALPYTDVYASADGIVYRVNLNPDSHAYGIHVRIRHQNGYRTVYGHLAKALVEVDEQVRAGQVIGKADSTGASTAAHLHFTLKQDGASARKETKYPLDVIDPTPFMVWPESTGRKKSLPSIWGQHFLAGVHLNSSDWETNDLGQILVASGMRALKVELTTSTKALERLRAARPEVWIVVRLGGDRLLAPCTPAEFLKSVMPRAHRFHALGVTDFEIGSSPNLQSEGWNRAWKSGYEYSAWFQEARTMIVEQLDGARVGFPGLAPGTDLSGWRQDCWRFLDEAAGAAQAADWIGVVSSWTTERELNQLAGGRRHLEYRNRFPDKPLVISEFGNPSLDVTLESKARQYREYLNSLIQEGEVAAAFLYQAEAAKDLGEPGLAEMMAAIGPGVEAMRG